MYYTDAPRLETAISICDSMIRRPPRSTRVRSSAGSVVYKRPGLGKVCPGRRDCRKRGGAEPPPDLREKTSQKQTQGSLAASYTPLRAHETVLDPVCRLPLAKTKAVYVGWCWPISSTNIRTPIHQVFLSFHSLPDNKQTK